jgi:soluble P-type ATPase
MHSKGVDKISSFVSEVMLLKGDNMITIDIPGFGRVEIEHLVSDFTGTLSENGHLHKDIKERLIKVSEQITVHILTADTFGTAKKELEGLNCSVHILEGARHDLQKEKYVEHIGKERVFALGNGNNDRKMLKAARVGVVVCLKEGCSVDALSGADIFVTSPCDALDLLLETRTMKATLRY